MGQSVLWQNKSAEFCRNISSEPRPSQHIPIIETRICWCSNARNRWKHTIHSRNRCLRFCHICNIKSGWTTCAAFHSRTLHVSEHHHSLVEKKGKAIVESIRHWKHFLLGHHFTLITDQQSLTYMYDYKASSKINNDKIMRWRVSLSAYSYDIHHHPGNSNLTPDTFTWITTFHKIKKLALLYLKCEEYL